MASNTQSNSGKTPVLTGEALWKREWSTDTALRNEFKSLNSYLAFMHANDKGLVKIKSKNS